MTHRYPYSARLNLIVAAAIAFAAPLAVADEHEITGTNGDDRLIGTPAADRFVGGQGADIFVINYLSTVADTIVDFEPEEGDALELAFNNHSGLPFQQENFSINRKGVVKVRIGAKQQDLARLNRPDLELKLDSRKGRYFLRFSKKI